jgi:hypothetical protein
VPGHSKGVRFARSTLQSVIAGQQYRRFQSGAFRNKYVSVPVLQGDGSDFSSRTCHFDAGGNSAVIALNYSLREKVDHAFGNSFQGPFLFGARLSHQFNEI